MRELRKPPVLVLMAALMALMPAACKKYEAQLPPVVEWNERPVDGYIATLKVTGMTKPYSVTATGFFGIENRGSCQPTDYRRSIGGSRHMYTEIQLIPVVKNGEDEYMFTFYQDAIKNADYYGLGECKWAGHPGFNLRTRDTVYALRVDNRSNQGHTIEEVCALNAVGPISSCYDPKVIATIDDSNYFHVTTNFSSAVEP